MLNLESALAIVDKYAAKIPAACETLATGDSLSRILAEDQHSLLDLPPFNKSAMDG